MNFYCDFSGRSPWLNALVPLQGTLAPGTAPSRAHDGSLELATALHHSAQRPKTVVEVPRVVEAHETNNALWRQKEPPQGARPGILAEPGPQRSVRGLRHSSGDCLPTLSTAGASGEAVDFSALSFLTAQALEAKRKEEQPEEEEEVLSLEEEEDPGGWFRAAHDAGRAYHWHHSSPRPGWQFPSGASVAKVWVPVQLLFMTSPVLPSVRPSDSPGDDFWNVFVFRATWLDSGYMRACLQRLLEIPDFLREGGSWFLGRFSSLLRVLPEECRVWTLLGDDFEKISRAQH